MKRLLLPLILFASIGATAQVKEKKIRKYAETIKVKDLKKKLSVIASAEMEGRGTATEGQRKAAAYIIDQFKGLGLLPGNGNSYEQVFNVYQDSMSAKSFVANGKPLEISKDYTFSLMSVPSGNWSIDNIYFAGAGALDTTNLPVSGKWVMIDEGGVAAMRLKIAQLKRRQAKGIITVSKTFPRRTAFSAKSSLYKDAIAEFPYIAVSYNAAAQILNKSSLDSASLVSLAKETYPTNTVINVAKQKITLESTNVLGLLPGTDRKDEYVFLTAHYDHIGKTADGVINYGADDDGSGTTGIIEIAEAFAAAKKKGHGPRRSIVFMAVSGEEYGLWGSEFYSDNPVFPLEKTTVDLNIDMIGRVDPKYKGDSMNYVYVIGDDKLSSDLRPITDSVNNKYIKMELDRRFTDVSDPNRYYYRSDHYNFARKGVPIIFYFNGTHADYHRPTDTIEKINFDLMEKRTRLVFYTAWEMANRDKMLKRNIPLVIPSR
jgi:hypothetical protein